MSKYFPNRWWVLVGGNLSYAEADDKANSVRLAGEKMVTLPL